MKKTYYSDEDLMNDIVSSGSLEVLGPINTDTLTACYDYVLSSPIFILAKYGYLDLVPPHLRTAEVLLSLDVIGGTPLGCAVCYGKAELIPKDMLNPALLKARVGSQYCVLWKIADRGLDYLFKIAPPGSFSLDEIPEIAQYPWSLDILAIPSVWHWKRHFRNISIDELVELKGELPKNMRKGLQLVINEFRNLERTKRRIRAVLKKEFS